MKTLSVRSKVWLEIDGKPLFGDGSLRQGLNQAVDQRFCTIFPPEE